MDRPWHERTLLTVSEYAEVVGVRPRTVWWWIGRGEFPAEAFADIPGVRRFRVSWVRRQVE